MICDSPVPSLVRTFSNRSGKSVDESSPLVISSSRKLITSSPFTRASKHGPADDGDDIPAHDFSTFQACCISVGYMLSMGVCGFIIVALGTTLSEIAANVGYSAYDIGTVFVARGAGCISGTLMSSVLYGMYNGKHMLCVTSAVTVLILYGLPYCRDFYLLHLAYFSLGMITSITETGSQLMMIKFHGSEAGPWCGANSMSFCVSGIIVPAVQMVTTDIYDQYNCYAAFVGFSAVWMIVCPDPENNGRILPKSTNSSGDICTPDAQTRHYNVEFLISFMIFLMIGGGESIMFYLKIYVNDTDVIPSESGPLLFLMFFVAVTVGKIIGIVDQAYLTNQTIILHFFVLLFGSAISLGAIWYYPDDANTLWLGIICFGLCQGPAISYCFDLCNRLALCSEVSISILMLGMNLGVSLVPYAASLYWSNYVGPIAIIDVGIWTMLGCIPILFIAPAVSYLKSIPYCALVSSSHNLHSSYKPIAGGHDSFMEHDQNSTSRGYQDDCHDRL